MATTHDDLRLELLEAARRVSASGVLSLSGHGNLSLRVPGRDEMLFTSGGSLRDLDRGAVVRVRLDGELLEGELQPMAGAVVHMHTAVYRDLDDATARAVHPGPTRVPDPTHVRLYDELYGRWHALKVRNQA